MWLQPSSKGASNMQVIECVCSVCAGACMCLFRNVHTRCFLRSCVYFCLFAFLVFISCVLEPQACGVLCVYGFTWCVCVCPHARVCVQNPNLLDLCLLKYIYMKRQLTFLSCLKPRHPDILLTVAGDILPHFPQENYITPLLSPLISLSNRSSSFLVRPTPNPHFSSSVYCKASPSYLTVSATVITLKRRGGQKKKKFKKKKKAEYNKISMSATCLRRDKAKHWFERWHMKQGRGVVCLGMMLLQLAMQRSFLAGNLMVALL